MYEVELLRKCCRTVSTTFSLQDHQSPEFKSFIKAQYCPWSTVPEWLADAMREYLLEKGTSSSTVMEIFNSDSGEQLNSCWYFLRLECEMENWLC